MQYEPELFPGLIYRMKVPKVVMLVFVSGKVVLTGAYLPGCCAVPLYSRGRPAVQADNCSPHMSHMQRLSAGAKSKNDIYEAFNQIYPVLAQFRKGAAAPHSAPALPPPAAAPASQVPSPAI